MAVSSVGSPLVAPKTVSEVEAPAAKPAAETPVSPPPESEVRAEYHRDEYRAAPADAPPAATLSPREMPIVDAVALRKELGPELTSQIQNLIFIANTTGATSPQTMKALAALLNENKGEFLKNLIPFMKAGSEMGEALAGRDAAGKTLNGGQRVWSFFKGLLGAAIDASTLGVGGRALAGVSHAYRAAQAVDTAESLTRWAPVIAELSKNGADPEIIAKLVELAKRPTVLQRVQGGAESAVTNPAPSAAALDETKAAG